MFRSEDQHFVTSFGFDGGSSPGNPGGNCPGMFRKGGGGGRGG